MITNPIHQWLEGKKRRVAFDIMVCSKCEKFVQERFSHHSEYGFSECCGKKLERKQGEKEDYSNYNSALTDLQSALPSLLSAMEGEIRERIGKMKRDSLDKKDPPEDVYWYNSALTHVDIFIHSYFNPQS